MVLAIIQQLNFLPFHQEPQREQRHSPKAPNYRTHVLGLTSTSTTSQKETAKVHFPSSYSRHSFLLFCGDQEAIPCANSEVKTLSF